MVALVQGLLGGLMFWWLGLSAPLLWGVLMGLLALVPILGAPVVWIPAAVYLATIGSWGKAVLLASWGTIGPASYAGTSDGTIIPKGC